MEEKKEKHSKKASLKVMHYTYNKHGSALKEIRRLRQSEKYHDTYKGMEAPSHNEIIMRLSKTGIVAIILNDDTAQSRLMALQKKYLLMNIIQINGKPIRSTDYYYRQKQPKPENIPCNSRNRIGIIMSQIWLKTN